MLVRTPFATAFGSVERVLPYEVKELRRWVRRPASVGSRSRAGASTSTPPSCAAICGRPGPRAATLVISRTPRGALVAVVERVTTLPS